MSTDNPPGNENAEDVKDNNNILRDRPTSGESSGQAASDADDGLQVVASHHSAPVLTLSKARAIALVATVTGASFLNVRD